MVAVGQARAEEADRPIQIAEDEAAEVARERLRAATDRDEVVVGAQVGNLRLDEPLLDRGKAARTPAPLGDVGADDAVFVDLEIVRVEHRRDPQPPVVRLEGPVAVVEFEGEGVVLEKQEAVGVAEEVLLPRRRRRFERRVRRRHLAEHGNRPADHFHVKESVLADDREILLEEVLGVGIEDVSEGVGVVVEALVPLAVAIPGGHPDPPAVLDGDEVARLLLLARLDARGTGEAGRRGGGVTEERIGDGALAGEVVGIVGRVSEHRRAARRLLGEILLLRPPFPIWRRGDRFAGGAEGIAVGPQTLDRPGARDERADGHHDGAHHDHARRGFAEACPHRSRPQKDGRSPASPGRPPEFNGLAKPDAWGRRESSIGHAGS